LRRQLEGRGAGRDGTEREREGKRERERERERDREGDTEPESENISSQPASQPSSQPALSLSLSLSLSLCFLGRLSACLFQCSSLYLFAHLPGILWLLGEESVREGEECETGTERGGEREGKTERERGVGDTEPER
jgi:hypothetical protein